MDRGWGCNEVIMGAMAFQITSRTIVYSTVYSRAGQRDIKDPRHWPLWGELTGDREFPAQRPVTRKIFQFHDVIMYKKRKRTISFKIGGYLAIRDAETSVKDKT